MCSQLSILVLPISHPTGLDRGWGLPEKKHLGIPLLLSVFIGLSVTMVEFLIKLFRSRLMEFIQKKAFLIEELPEVV